MHVGWRFMHLSTHIWMKINFQSTRTHTYEWVIYKWVTHENKSYVCVPVDQRFMHQSTHIWMKINLQSTYTLTHESCINESHLKKEFITSAPLRRCRVSTYMYLHMYDQKVHCRALLQKSSTKETYILQRSLHLCRVSTYMYLHMYDQKLIPLRLCRLLQTSAPLQMCGVSTCVYIYMYHQKVDTSAPWSYICKYIYVDTLHLCRVSAEVQSIYTCIFTYVWPKSSYGVATISRLLRIIPLFGE